MPPVMVPTVQLNELAALAVKLMLVLLPLQLFLVLAVVTAGVGLIVTVTFWVLVQLPGAGAVRVIAYATLTGFAVVLISVSVMVLPLAFTTAALLIPATSALDHENVVPAVALVAVYVPDVPLHLAGGVKLLLSVDLGFITKSVAARQPGNDGHWA